MRKIHFAKNNIYHIYNRGVEKRDVFMNENDRWRFLQALFLFNNSEASHKLLWDLERLHKGVNFKVIKDYIKTQGTVRQPLVRVLADCLMPNHYHLILEELEEGGITKFMHKLGTGYTGYFNKKYKRVGGLFQGTFKAKSVDDDLYLQYLLVYINVMNPGQLVEPDLKEQGVKDLDAILDFAAEFPWSTHKEYLGTRESIIVDKGVLGTLFPSGESYREFVHAVLPQQNEFEKISHLFLE
ncbi:MAG: transposase [Candidatus Wildermuthbacteria bacterium]|nr:transposase [Candidatus Wildermuthbacteria bacterium]